MNTPVFPKHSEAERLVEAASDALTDDMVVRLAKTAGDAMELLDRVNRSGLDKAVPILAELVDNGDLARLVQLGRLMGSAEDALTDDMVSRLASTLGDALNLMDRVTRCGLDRFIGVIEHLEATGALAKLADALPRLVAHAENVERILGCLDETVQEERNAPRPVGGISALWSLMRDQESGATLRFFLAFGGRLRNACGRG